MNIQKCDICKKKIEDNFVKVRAGLYDSKDLCVTCGKPVIDFLKKNKLISEDRIKKLYE